MDDRRLAEIEASHVAALLNPERCDGCEMSSAWPCDAAQLVIEVRRLRRALHLSELSRGVLVGQD